MPSGNGYFFNRKTKRYIKIYEHATDAVTRPKVFGTEEIKHLNPVTDRDQIVIHVLKNGFIRVRDWAGYLGWQFWGDPDDALKILKKYIKKHEIGNGYVITFTDFETGKQIQANTNYFINNQEVLK
jgi:hypothetical protein